MAKARRKTEPKKQSITIKNVPTEYVELFNTLAKWFPRTGEQVHTSPKANSGMPISELRTLFFCELIHQNHDVVFSAGSAQRHIENYRYHRNLRERYPTPE